MAGDDARELPGNGATDGPEALRLRLPSAPPSYLSAAVDNPSLGAEEIVLILRNRQAPAILLRKIASRARWTALREVKGLLARHPRAPLALARRFLPHLAWTDLAEIARDVRSSPVVRRDAERLLVLRLPGMALGERIALARKASRRLFATLRADPEAPVLRALLENPRATDADAVALASSPATPRTFLEHLSAHSRFGRTAVVRRPLLRNPALPVPAALRLLARAPREEIAVLARDEGAPRIVRLAAGRRLT